jgi:hypothetical protein
MLQRAREREDIEIDSVVRPPAPPQRVPHPLPDGERN